MGKLFDQIDQGLEEFIRTQKMFFVATAPLDGAGHVNLSPKGLDTLRVLDPQTMVYLDYVGSLGGHPNPAIDRHLKTGHHA
jgi:predicted pyridoxine 5'-phosphate oxidase superfamily flavin-nucleotide-binding protein